MAKLKAENVRDQIKNRRKDLSTAEVDAFERVASKSGKVIEKLRVQSDNKHADAQLTQRIMRSVINDISPLPEIVNPERRKACERNLALACKTYFPEKFKLDWSQDHIDLLSLLENSILNGGGKCANAHPRGHGKTTIAECAGLWALLNGHRRYMLLICATGGAAKDLQRSIHTEIETNDLLLEDFPEAIYPIRQLRGSYFRARFQHIEGEPTRINLSSELIMLPYVDGSKSANSIIQATSITGRIRGISQTVGTGEKLRPDFVIVDDPQTDKTAKSPHMTEQRERIINGTIVGLAGPGKDVAIVMPCTVIAKDDLSERFLNQEKRPQWQGQRSKLMPKMPTNWDLWQQYNEIRGNGLRRKDNGTAAREFYIRNQAALEEGAVISWPQRFNPNQVSAIQFAMDLYFDDPRTFASEYQNEPLADTDSDAAQRLILHSEAILNRFSGHRTLTVPKDTVLVTTGVDVQSRLLYYLTTAWKEDFGGVIVDYGTFPKQGLDYFLAANPPKTLNDVEGFDKMTLNPQVFEALERLYATVIMRTFIRDGVGGEERCSRCGIDANWSQVADAVYGFCKKYEQMNFFHPMHGKGIGAAQLPMDQWPVRAGEIRGKQPWIQKFATAANKGKHITFDANWWKSLVAERLIAPEGSPKALLIAGDYSSRHQLLADHLSSELPVKTHGRGRDVDEWKAKPASENHWWDCLVMSAVMANVSGLIPHDITNKPVDGSGDEEISTSPIPKKERKVVSMKR